MNAPTGPQAKLLRRQQQNGPNEIGAPGRYRGGSGTPMYSILPEAR